MKKDTGCLTAVIVSLALIILGNLAYRSKSIEKLKPIAPIYDSLIIKPDSVKIRIGKDSFIIKILKYEKKAEDK